MSLKNTGENATAEFFETLIHGVAYEEAREQISNMTSTVNSPLIKDAIQSSMTVVTSGLIFFMMRKQEDYIQGLFTKAGTLLASLGSLQLLEKAKNKLTRGLKGTKASKFLGMFQSSASDKIATGNLVVNTMTSNFHAERTAQADTSTIGNATQVKEHIINKESHHHAVGNSMASRYNETLMFKLFTKSFTASDETVIKKILGRETASVVNIDDMNKVADFMFVTDDTGNVTGLAEQFLTLLNGMGYTHK